MALERCLSLSCHRTRGAFQLRQIAVHRETDVDEGDEGGHNVSDVGRLVVVSLWNLERRCGDRLLPTKTHVSAENEDSAHVEDHPTTGLEQLILQTVDVAHGHLVTTRCSNPEEVQ